MFASSIANNFLLSIMIVTVFMRLSKMKDIYQKLGIISSDLRPPSFSIRLMRVTCLEAEPLSLLGVTMRGKDSD